MRVRAQDASGDMQFGRGGLSYLVNTPAAVAQLILSRLKLNQGEWFLDVTDGTAWLGGVLGAHTQGTRDRVIRARILGTVGVTAITSYSSAVVGRNFTVDVGVSTLYGPAQVQAVL